jgi:hypothetical protein
MNVEEYYACKANSLKRRVANHYCSTYFSFCKRCAIDKVHDYETPCIDSCKNRERRLKIYKESLDELAEFDNFTKFYVDRCENMKF